MKLRFWGVRGSIPSPGPNTRKYGGNTACIELRVGPDERLIIIDAGSGMRTLGNSLVASDLPKGPIKADIFLSHTHWDHIIGYPFFTPIYIPGTRLKVHGPGAFEQEVLGGQLRHQYFPVNMGELASEIDYVRLGEAPHLDLGDGLVLRTKLLNHPITTLGYRFEYGGRAVCTCYDTEPFRSQLAGDPAQPADAQGAAGEEAMAQNLAVERFFAGADLLIYDAQYTADEYHERQNWGHTAIEYAIAAANRAGVKRLALFHHDPDRADEALDQLAEIYCRPENGATEVFFAREGMEIVC